MSEILIEVSDPGRGQARDYCSGLEQGKILFFPQTPFVFPNGCREFLLGQRQSRYHKNIAYRPLQDRVTGASPAGPEDAERLLRCLRAYSQAVEGLLKTFLAPYAQSWLLDYASFRPFQEEGRGVRVRARNDLLHIDNFPTRPTNGRLILRFFTNINPDEAREWAVAGPFERLLEYFGGKRAAPWPRTLAGLERFRYSVLEKARSKGLPVVARPPYDQFMLRLHHSMKEDATFQKTFPKTLVSFPPGSSWIAFTDTVAHAVLSGQYALEQTFLISPESLINRELAPVRIVEQRSGRAPLTARAV